MAALAGAGALAAAIFGDRDASERSLPFAATVETITVPADGALLILGDDDSTPLAPRLSAFSNERRKTDELPSGVLAPFGRPSEVRAQRDRSRRLLMTRSVRIYAAPTSNGSVCYELVPQGTGGCAGSVAELGYPTVETGGAGFPGVVHGLIGDDVVDVDVVLGRRARSAELGRNAYFYELPAGVAVPSAVVVRKRGSRIVYRVEVES